jgi:hypothetical protein
VGLAEVGTRVAGGDDPIKRSGRIPRLARLRRAAGRIDRFYWGSGPSDDVPALAWHLVGACVP